MKERRYWLKRFNLLVATFALVAAGLSSQGRAEPRVDMILGKTLYGVMWADRRLAIDELFTTFHAHYPFSIAKEQFTAGLALTFGDVSYDAGSAKKQGDLLAMALTGGYQWPLGVWVFDKIWLYGALVVNHSYETVSLKHSNTNGRETLTGSLIELEGNLGLETWAAWEFFQVPFFLAIPARFSFSTLVGLNYHFFSKERQQTSGGRSGDISRSTSSDTSSLNLWLGVGANAHIW